MRNKGQKSVTYLWPQHSQPGARAGAPTVSDAHPRLAPTLLRLSGEEKPVRGGSQGSLGPQTRQHRSGFGIGPGLECGCHCLLDVTAAGFKEKRNSPPWPENRIVTHAEGGVSGGTSRKTDFEAGTSGSALLSATCHAGDLGQLA